MQQVYKAPIGIESVWTGRRSEECGCTQFVIRWQVGDQTGEARQRVWVSPLCISPVPHRVGKITADENSNIPVEPPKITLRVTLACYGNNDISWHLSLHKHGVYRPWHLDWPRGKAWISQEDVRTLHRILKNLDLILNEIQVAESIITFKTRMFSDEQTLALLGRIEEHIKACFRVDIPEMDYNPGNTAS